MTMIIQVLLLTVGFALLIKGADWFVEGASNLADRFGIPQLVIGLTIVALGTSLPEAAVSISAALKGSAGITVGNVVGSNILNVLIILGLTAVIRPIAVQKSTVYYELPFTIAVTALLAGLGLWNNQITRGEGLLFLGLMVLYLLYLLRMSQKGNSSPEEKQTQKKKDSMFKMLLMIVAGGVMIVLGSDVTVDAATSLATMFGMDDRFIGLTIVALGTSLPELVTSATAAVKGKADIAIGNIVGSNIFNILFVVGISAVITPVLYSADFVVDSFVAIGSVILLLICVLPKKKLGRSAGVVMLAGYAAYFIYLIQ